MSAESIIQYVYVDFRHIKESLNRSFWILRSKGRLHVNGSGRKNCEYVGRCEDFVCFGSRIGLALTQDEFKFWKRCFSSSKRSCSILSLSILSRFDSFSISFCFSRRLEIFENDFEDADESSLRFVDIDFIVSRTRFSALKINT